MSIKFSQLPTYWDADDTYMVIVFLDEVRDVLWATYGTEIIEQQQREHQWTTEQDNRQQFPSMLREHDVSILDRVHQLQEQLRNIEHSEGPATS